MKPGRQNAEESSMLQPEPDIGTPPPDRVVGRIETDRFCDECGFNMRTAPVFRDERTRLLLSRCTECGRIHHAATATTAGRVWLQRLGVMAVFAWMALIIFATFVLTMVEMGMQMATLDELTEYVPGGGGRTPRTDMDEYPEFMALVLGVSAAAGFVMILLYSCAAHHWKRIYHMMLAALMPMIPLITAWRAWYHEAPMLEHWAWRYLLLHATVQVTAGLIAALYGRPLVRLLATLLLPSRTRTLIGFLWLADGLMPPAVHPRSAEHGRE